MRDIGNIKCKIKKKIFLSILSFFFESYFQFPKNVLNIFRIILDNLHSFNSIHISIAISGTVTGMPVLDQLKLGRLHKNMSVSKSIYLLYRLFIQEYLYKEVHTEALILILGNFIS